MTIRLNTLLIFQHIGDKKMKKITLCALVASTLFTSSSMAATNPWTECGIGAMIFDNNGAAAAISNIIWDLGTTAVTTKVSSESSCAGANVQAAIFIQDNYNVVLEQTSQGAGDHLTAMLDMLNVDAAQQPQVISSVRAQIAAKVVAEQATPETYYNVVMANI